MGIEGIGDGMRRAVASAEDYALVFDVTRVLWRHGSKVGLVKW